MKTDAFWYNCSTSCSSENYCYQLYQLLRIRIVFICLIQQNTAKSFRDIYYSKCRCFLFKTFITSFLFSPTRFTHAVKSKNNKNENKVKAWEKEQELSLMSFACHEAVMLTSHNRKGNDTWYAKLFKKIESYCFYTTIRPICLVIYKVTWEVLL